MADFGVYIAGEEIEGVGITYVYIATPRGMVRMTADEAAVLGANLIRAAQVDAEMADGG